MEDRYEQVPYAGQTLVYEERPPIQSAPDLASVFASHIEHEVKKLIAEVCNPLHKRIEALETKVEALEVEQENLDETLYMMRRQGDLD